MIPPSSDVITFRMNPLASLFSTVAFGSKSPAICSTVNLSNGLFWLNDFTTQSRQSHVVRSESL